jgi:hypothetical protein
VIWLRSVVLALVLALGGCGITAPQHSAGYADLDGLSWRDVDRTMNLSLGPTMLRIIAAGIDDDPRARELVRSLEGVRVRVYQIDREPVAVAENLEAMTARLRQTGWEPVMRVREGGETAHMLMKLEQERIAGLAVLASDGLEVVLINVMGDIRPELFSEAMATVAESVPPVEV